MYKWRLLAGVAIFLNLFFHLSFAQPLPGDGKGFLARFIHDKLPGYHYLFSNPAKYRIQIIFTQVDRDKNNRPKLTTYSYRNLSGEFISPASMVKLPLSLLSLEKLNSVKVPGLTKESPYISDSSFRCQVPSRKDHFTLDSVLTISSTITEALVVSDNEAYNRLYEFLGQREINHRMWDLGYINSRIIQRFSVCDSVANRHTGGFTFFDNKGAAIYRQAPQYNSEVYPRPLKNMVVGKGYLDERNHLIKRGMDFSKRNYLSLFMVDDILKRVIFPEIFPVNKQWNITLPDLDFIRRQLALRPAETEIPAFRIKRDYWETYTNYLFYGCEEDALIPENIRIFNIVGQSFGFLSDCAYYTDFANRIEFFLSATIYVNNDEILNDGKYEYKTIGFPFMKQLGQAIVEYERQRKVKYRPDLSTMEKLFRP